MINPIIFVIFNSDFRKAFKDLLLYNCLVVSPRRSVRTGGVQIGKDNEFEYRWRTSVVLSSIPEHVPLRGRS